MPISRKKHHIVNKSKARARRKEFEMKFLAGQIHNQDVLDYCLLDIEDVWKRRSMFDAIRPHLPFNAVFPSRINMPALTHPAHESLLVRP